MSKRSDPSLIRECSVAVVGGAGFLGSHCVDHLIEDRGCKVLVLDNLVAGRREFIHPKATFAHADITGSEGELRRLFQEHQVRWVFNYAAWPYVVDSFTRPLHVFNVNAMGALKVINAAQEAEVEGILQISSAELYGNGAVQWTRDSLELEASGHEPQGAWQERDGGPKIKEYDSVAPHSSYGAAKAAIDAAVQVRWREAGTRCTALRQFNCIGERDVTHPYVVPEIVKQLATQLEDTGGPVSGGIKKWQPMQNPGIVDLGNNSTRDFLYAGDQARMAVELLEKGQWGEVYNLGSEYSVRIYDLARLIGKMMGFKDVDVVEDESRKRPWEIWHLQSDNSKIHATIDARPQVGLREALQRTLDWYCQDGWRLP